MNELPIEIGRLERGLLMDFLNYLKERESCYLLWNEIQNSFVVYCYEVRAEPVKCEETTTYRFLRKIQELIIREDSFVVVYRYKLAVNYVYDIDKELNFSQISISEYLRIRDLIITGKHPDRNLLNIDFLPFYDYSPSIKDPKDIGQGVAFLNKVLSNKIFQDPENWNSKLFKFISIHKMDDQQLLIDKEKIRTLDTLKAQLDYMIEHIGAYENKKNQDPIYKEMKELGFTRGWGDNIGKIKETMQLLLDLFNNPDPQHLADFISRIPMISKIAIISPHGWFGQKNVLGKPDTGGQVVYILDQVRYLEKFLKESLSGTGLKIEPKIVVLTRLIPDHQETTCHLAREKIEDTDNCWIVRVPFRDKEGAEIPHWISRFHIWPHLEGFAEESKEVLENEFNGRPDLIIGNYSDGNMVATMLSNAFGVTQCNIAHALEKSKYIFSDLYWQEKEKDYNFSLQFTADLISMNMASFIITSTSQEITGTQDARGQYETYQFFSMPDLYHVRGGVNLFHPKFNVIPPGVPEDVYFPYSEEKRRDSEVRDRVSHWIFESDEEFIYGKLDDPQKVPIYSMARLDKIKNLTGLVESYATNEELRNMANLIVVGGTLKAEWAQDEEERSEVHRMYELFEKYNLHGSVRWIARTFKREESGEIYRVMADRRGVFVQPALFEAFGLTVIEAMASGLPTFATRFGGPSETIRDGEDGFLINPTLYDELSSMLLVFFIKSEEDPAYWDEISRNGIRRVHDSFNWTLYAQRLVRKAKLHGFWKYSVSIQAKEKLKLYCDLIYDDFIRKRLPE